MPAKWKKATVWVGFLAGPERRDGYEYRGLALFRWRDHWSLTHVGSGLKVTALFGPLQAAKHAGAVIAECANWDWSGPDGYKNVEPTLKEKLTRACAGLNIQGPRFKGTSDDARAVAQEIARLRA